MNNPILNVLARQPTSFEAVQSGRAAAEGQRTNALRQQGMQSDLNQRTRVNALADDERKHREDLEGAQLVLSSPNPKAVVMQRYKHLIADPAAFEAMSDDEIRGFAQQVHDEARVKLAGFGDKPAPQLNALRGANGETLYTYGNSLQVVQPQKEDNWRERLTATTDEQIRRELATRPPQQGPQFRPMTPDEIKTAGLPDGTSAQISNEGKIDVLSKRDNIGALSQKDATTAKQKLTTIRVARKQLADIKKAFDEGRNVIGPNSFGPGQGALPTERGLKFDAAVDRMRSTLTALTRVPGVGAMSDYETKLDQGKFPKRNTYESVTAEQIQGIEDLLSTIESGYNDLLGGTSSQQPGAPQPGTVEDGYRFKGGDPANPDNWEQI